MNTFELLAYAALVGTVATVVLDVAALMRQRLFATPLANYDLVGRWIGHMWQGRFVHESIGRASAVRGEQWLGWVTHYLVGIGFAALLLTLTGAAWIDRPTPGPALAVGLISVLAPFLLMQPGMGAGLAARRTPNPSSARLRSLVTHAIFGVGLYMGGWVALFLRQVANI